MDGTMRLTVTKHLSMANDSPQYDFIVVVLLLVEELHEVVGKHAGFSCWRYCTMPPATRLHLNVGYHGSLHEIQLVQLAGRVVKLHYCTDWKADEKKFSFVYWNAMFRLDVPHTRPALKTHEKCRIFMNCLRSSLNQQLPRYKQKAKLILVVAMISSLRRLSLSIHFFAFASLKPPHPRRWEETRRNWCCRWLSGGVSRVNPNNSSEHTNLENKTIESFVWINKNSEIGNIRIAVDFRLSPSSERLPERAQCSWEKPVAEEVNNRTWMCLKWLRQRAWREDDVIEAE